MTKLIFSFDTEDYINEKAADGIIRASRIVREAGYTPCHGVVAWLLKALVEWGRQDVIDELKRCEIGTHTLKHSYHPVINEYTDIEDYNEAYRRFREEEDEALAIIREILGVERPTYAMPPGDSVSYVGHYAWADMGIEIYNGDFTCDQAKGRPVSYCNMLSTMYCYSFDRFTEFTHEEVLERMDKLAELDFCMFYHHPQLNVITRCCDGKNFLGGKNVEGGWILGDEWPEENVRRFEDNLRFFLKKLKDDKRFEVITFEQLAAEYRCERSVYPSQIPELRKALAEDFFPVTVPESLCLSDILLACRDFLTGKDQHVCGKVYGFLDTPYAIPHPVRVTAEEMRASAAQIKDGAFLPAEIEVGGKKLGPADWLRASLIILSGADKATVVPDKWQIDLNQFPWLRDLCFTGSWCHADDFPDRYVSDRNRLQTWTIRLPKGTQRKIW